MSDGDPCYPPTPDLGLRFVHESGGGFTMGLACSSIFHSLRGLRRGGGGLAGAARAVGANAPRAAGSLAAYFAVWSALEGAMSLARRKDDTWDGLAAGAAAWAALGLRRGAVGAALLAVSSSVDIIDGRIPELDTPRRRQPTEPLPAAADGGWAAPATGGFLGIPQGPPIVVQEVPAGDHGL